MDGSGEERDVDTLIRGGYLTASLLDGIWFVTGDTPYCVFTISDETGKVLGP